MTQTNHVILGSINARQLVETIDDKRENSEILTHMFSSKAIELLLERTIVCYVSPRKLGKNRILSDSETLSIIKHVKHISPSSYIDFLRMLPMVMLDQKSINIIFIEDKEAKVQDHLLNMMFLNRYKIESSRNGKIDYLKLENDFKNDLSNGKKVKEYISSSRRYSYASVLHINARTFLQGKSK